MDTSNIHLKLLSSIKRDRFKNCANLQTDENKISLEVFLWEEEMKVQKRSEEELLWIFLERKPDQRLQ
ncbi:MAG TPA: hypothetical protein DCX03_07905 [Bacteroidales bacterium]|nr:hypothetical protein [Bacteroidales bacterium]